MRFICFLLTYIHAYILSLKKALAVWESVWLSPLCESLGGKIPFFTQDDELYQERQVQKRKKIKKKGKVNKVSK